MVQTVPATEATLYQLKQALGLSKSQDLEFFTEWQTSGTDINQAERVLLDRVQTNFLALMEDPPMLENSVKMVVLAPLLDICGFYRKPFKIETETSTQIEMQDEGITIRGRIDVLVMKDRLWLLVIESKRSDFAVSRAIPQALSYMLSNPSNQPNFGLITNGHEFLFLKTELQPTAIYDNSRLFSLLNPQNELYSVIQILKLLGLKQIAQGD